MFFIIFFIFLFTFLNISFCSIKIVVLRNSPLVSVSCTPQSFPIMRSKAKDVHYFPFNANRQYNVWNRERVRWKKSKHNLFLIATRILCISIAGGFILCSVATSALCLIHSAAASQSTCITNTVRSKKNNILCNDVTFTLLPEQPAAFEWPCKWNRGLGGEGGRHGLVAMGACILTANPWWFDWGPWQWTAPTFDPVQPASLSHSQTHPREPRADCPKIVPSLIRRFFFSLIKKKSSGMSPALPLKRPYVCDQWCWYLGVNCLIHCRGLIRFLSHLLPWMKQP